MYCNYMFPFRLEKEANMGIMENGDPAEAYMKIDLKQCKKEITKEKYDEMHQKFISDLAKQFNCDPKYIIPITGDEFEANTDEN